MIEEEQIKNKKALPIMVVICITVMVIAIGSYALWQMTGKQTNRNVVGTACLSITFDDTTKDKPDDISLDDAWPISDSEGSETEPYTFTIENHCGDAVNYSVGLESIEDAGKSSSDYLNYNYIRVKLDSESAQTYGTLTSLTDDINQSYTIRDTKEIAYHTLAANGSVTHSLRLWVDENTPLQEQDGTFNTEKYFYGKIKVVAGQNIEGDQIASSGLKLLSDPNEPDVTLSNIQVGDLVGYQTEQFYVIGIDGSDVKLLSRYLINVGDHQKPDATQGLQYAELGRTRPSLNSEPEKYEFEGEDCWCDGEEDEETGECLEEETCEPNGSTYYYGSVPFANDAYWFNESNSFVYNDQSNVKQYVDKYVNTLQAMGLNVTNGILLSLEELSTLCNTTITKHTNYSSQCPNYIFETSYWLGNVSNDSWVWSVGADGHVGGVYFSNDYAYAVRPVITVSLS